MPITLRSRIRDYEPDDFETLWHIDQDCFPRGISYSRTELKTYLRRKGSFALVAVSLPPNAEGVVSASSRTRKGGAEEESREPISGFIVAEHARGTGHVITIDVVADARRGGVGSLLLEAAEQRLKGMGCNLVELEAAVDNSSAISFYKRHAYSVVGTFPRYYSNGVDALVLQKQLTREES